MAIREVSNIFKCLLHHLSLPQNIQKFFGFGVSRTASKLGSNLVGPSK